MLSPREKRQAGSLGACPKVLPKGPGSVSALILFPVPTLLVLFRHKYSLPA